MSRPCYISDLHPVWVFREAPGCSFCSTFTLKEKRGPPLGVSCSGPLRASRFSFWASTLAGCSSIKVATPAPSAECSIFPNRVHSGAASGPCYRPASSPRSPSHPKAWAQSWHRAGCRGVPTYCIALFQIKFGGFSLGLHLGYFFDFLMLRSG